MFLTSHNTTVEMCLHVTVTLVSTDKQYTWRTVSLGNSTKSHLHLYCMFPQLYTCSKALRWRHGGGSQGD